MRLLFILFFSVSAMAAEESSVTQCRASRKLIAEICKGKKECEIKNDKQYEESLKRLREAPLGGQTINASEIKKLLAKAPTKESINDILSKLSVTGTCELNTYYKLASAVGRYHLRVKIPQSIAATKQAVGEWLRKDMATEYPSLLSLLIRTKIATEYAGASVVQLSSSAQKELDQMVQELEVEKQKFSGPQDGKADPAKKWAPKTWHAKLIEEFAVTKKFADRWLKWLEANWK